MRGRGRKGPNPLTRTYESNGAGVKIRGAGLHFGVNYQELARDAQASGDRVMSENYNQHAEHYLRIVAAAQPQQQPAAQATARPEAEEGGEPAPANANGHSNGSEHPQQEGQAPDSDLVDADSPQPFIEDMPVIDQEGKVNGAAQKAEGGEEPAEEKPRRRTRTPRARTPRRAASDTANGEAPAEAAAPDPTEAAAEGDAPAKPRRKTARPRRAKTTEETPTEVVPASE